MLISNQILISFGAEVQSYLPNQFIFNEGNTAKYYYQIKNGTVKLNNYFENGKEFIHGFPFDGHCIGESYLFTENLYAMNAVAITKCEIIRLEKHKFLRILLEEPLLFFKLNEYTADRLHFRYIVSTFLAISDPDIRIKKLLDHIKNYFNHQEKYSFLVPYTRQQLAALVGLRVETVIRSIKKMQKINLLKIDGNKIYY
ncbi:Crp/Fnr family transcriptional regulator [Chryseobacterium luquanense]|nr:Crp/Fnr family transcriptional regulator [Chryseobacterium luquanense]